MARKHSQEGKEISYTVTNAPRPRREAVWMTPARESGRALWRRWHLHVMEAEREWAGTQTSTGHF